MKKREGEARVNGVLHKPVELDKLLAIIRLHHPPGERTSAPSPR